MEITIYREQSHARDDRALAALPARNGSLARRGHRNSTSPTPTAASTPNPATDRGWRRSAASAGMVIRFAVGQCSLGAILVAASERGICAIAIGDDPEPLVRELQGRFSNAELIGGESESESWVAQVVGLVEAPRHGLDLPLDLRGTAFQQRVWQALQGIPAGTTLSYSELARRLGMPRSTRAVAHACAANTLAVAIPCHRVVRNDGGLAQYRWGVERKRALIEREADGGNPTRSTETAQ